jgi:hypothetical protein
MSKFLKSLPIIFILFFVSVGIVNAESLMLKGVDMPSWINKEPFYISYTALEAEGNSIKVFGYIKKEGNDWKEVGNSTESSASFKVDSGFLSGDGVYKIYFKDKSGLMTDEESFNIDFSGPDPVSDYRKERKDALVYKLCWKNPYNEDFNRTIVYRSDKKEFTADSSTQITEVGGAKNEEKCWENNLSENKDYYYVTRTIDHAGNASSVRGDSEAITTNTSNALVTEVTPAVVETFPLPIVKVQEDQKEGELGGAGSTQSAEESSTDNNFIENIKQIL